MFDTKIEIRRASQETNTLNELTDKLDKVGSFWAQKTEAGGRENMYASRIVHENEVIFTLRYTKQIEAGMFVIYEKQTMRIISVHDEGRRWRRHIKCIKSDANPTD